MNKLLQIKERARNSQLLKIILINLVFLIGLMLMYEPVEKLDDYRMKFTLAGAATGEYSCHLLYSNIFLGYALELLTRIIPGVSWYEMTQYIVLFLSFGVMVYLVQKRKLGTLGNGIIAVVLFVFGYEAYIKLTFSKTAGIASAVGMMLLLTALDGKKIRKKENLVKGLLALFLIVVGASLRFKVFMMIFALSLYIVLFRTCCLYLDTPKQERKELAKRLFSVYCRRMAVLLLVFCAMYGLNQAGDYAFSRHEEWKNYQEYNKLKVQLQDYGWPPYQDYYEEYQDLGISEVDYQMWMNRDYSDPDIFTMELMQKVVELRQRYEEENSKSILDFFREYPALFLKETTFWPVFLLLVFYCMSRQKHARLFLTSSIGMLILVNLYFFTIDRYQKHHIDLGIWFLMALIVISCLEATDLSRVKRSILPISMVFLIWFVQDNYSYMKSNTYYGNDRKVTAEMAREFLEYASADSEHLYVTSNEENRYAYMGYSVFEQIPKESYRNIYCLADYMYPSHRVSLVNYGVYNIYREMVNNNRIYYFISQDVPINYLETLVSYIQENYNENAFYSCVKQINGVGVYRIFAGGIYVDASQAIENLKGITADLTAYFQNETALHVNGLVYKEGTNSYNQNVYLEMTDKETGLTIYQVLTQYENYLGKDVMNGKYGRVMGSYYVLPEEWNEADEYHVILECEDGTYRIPLEVTAN